MKPYYCYIQSLLLAFAVLMGAACSNDAPLLSEKDEEVSVTFQPRLSGDLNTRTLGDASHIDQIKVFVYENVGTLSHRFTYTGFWSDVQQNGVTLTLAKGRTYSLLFWAEDKYNTAYDITDEGQITVNYSGYTQGGFAKMEEMDAFYGTAAIIVGPNVSGIRNVSLTRPFAQLNFMDNVTTPVAGIHKSVVTFHNIPTAFNPFTGEVTQINGNDITFEFADFTNETMEVNGTNCSYVASNYLFAPTESTSSVSVTIVLQCGLGNSLTTRFLEFKNEKAIILEKNKKTNVVGALLP